MKFSSISPFLGSSYKMTNENVRFFSPFFQLQKYIYFLNCNSFFKDFSFAISF